MYIRITINIHKKKHSDQAMYSRVSISLLTKACLCELCMPWSLLLPRIDSCNGKHSCHAWLLVLIISVKLHESLTNNYKDSSRHKLGRVLNALLGSLKNVSLFHLLS